MRRDFLLASLATVVSACAGRPPSGVDAARVLAPSGRLRAAINFGNPILANRAPDGSAAGVSVDLARELGRRLRVPVDLVPYPAAGRVTDAVRAGAWDVGFVAIDPLRGMDMDYSAAYVIIEGAYVVRESSPIKSNDEVDRPGIRVVAGRGSAYDLYLSRELKSAKIVHAPTSQAVVDTFMAQGLEVAAGVKQQVEADARRVPGLRLLPGRFMVINQAMAIPKGRDGGLPYLRAFVEEMKSTGFVAASLARHRIEGASVAPAARD